MGVMTDARAAALLGMLRLKKKPVDTQSITIFEARRRLIWAVNMWDRKCHLFARTYTVRRYDDQLKRVEEVQETVTWQQLQEDLEGFEQLLEAATKFGATSIAWA